MFFARRNIIIAISAVLLLAGMGIACWQFAYVRPHRLLLRAEVLMQARPDSALHTLQQLRRPQWLMGENEALYALLMTQACYKNGLPVENDSLIRIATRHYATASDPLRYAWSLFYEGQVARDTGNPKQALDCYQKAGDIAPQCLDYKLCDLLYFYWGDLLQKEKPYSEAIAMFKESLRYGSLLKDTASIIYTLNRITWSHILDKDYAAARLRAGEAIRLSKRVHDGNKLSTAYQNMGVALEQEGRLKEALAYADSVLSNDAIDPRFRNAAFSLKYSIFLAAGQTDSARYYIEKSKYADEWGSIAAYHYYLSMLEEQEGNYPAALESMRLYAAYKDTIQENERRNQLMALQKKYDYVKMQNENNLLKAKNQRQGILLLAFAVAFVVILFAIYYLYNVRSRKKEAILREKDRQLDESLSQLQQAASELVLRMEKESRLQAKVLVMNDALRHIKTVNGMAIAEKEKNAGNLKLSAAQVADLMEIVDLCYDNFVKRLRGKFPSLSGDDLCLCCLLKINVKNRDVAVLLGMSDDALKKRKYRIKHEKLGLEQSVSVESFLESF